jgi:hypothetical protein
MPTKTTEADRRAALRDLLYDDGCCYCHASPPCALHLLMTEDESAAYDDGGASAVIDLIDDADEEEDEA